MFYEKMTIHCSTEEEAADLMQMFQAEGIRWNGGEDPLEYMPLSPLYGTWYSITKRCDSLRGGKLVITYSHSCTHRVGYQCVEYADLLRDDRRIKSITSIEAFV